MCFCCVVFNESVLVKQINRSTFYRAVNQESPSHGLARFGGYKPGLKVHLAGGHCSFHYPLKAAAKKAVFNRGSEKFQVSQCLGFFTADLQAKED